MPNRELDPLATATARRVQALLRQLDLQNATLSDLGDQVTMNAALRADPTNGVLLGLMRDYVTAGLAFFAQYEAADDFLPALATAIDVEITNNPELHSLLRTLVTPAPAASPAPEPVSAGTRVTVGDISGVSGGSINIAGGNIIRLATGETMAVEPEQRQAVKAAVAEMAGASAYLPPTMQPVIQAEVAQLDAAAEAETVPDEGWWQQRFRNIAAIAPDIVDVFLASLAGPVAGLTAVAKKVAERAKAEAAAENDNGG